MGKNILIIDREEDIRRNLGALLDGNGYCHRSAEDYEEAMALVQSEPFDLILMEIRISNTSGFDFLHKVKKLYSHIEIIVLTGSVSIDNTIKALQYHGAFDFLTKPLESADKLLHSIEKALHNQRINRSVFCGLDNQRGE